MYRYILLAILAIAGCATIAPDAPTKLNEQQFEDLLDRVAEGWNDGNSRVAADCFTVDAIYVEPPKKQVYLGREALFRFFGGDAGRPGVMNMRWQRVVFDETTQRGMGEFTFRYGSQVHGVAVIDLRHGLISQWREYWYTSDMPFDQFVSPGVP